LKWLRDQLTSAWSETLLGRPTFVGVMVVAVLIRAWRDFPFVAAVSIIVYMFLLAVIAWAIRSWRGRRNDPDESNTATDWLSDTHR